MKNMSNKFKISEYKEKIIDEIKYRAETKGIEPSDYLEMILEKDTAKKPKYLLADLFINWECPNCHRAIHYGTIKEKKSRLILLYNQKIEKLKTNDIYIDFEELINKYYL